MAATPTTSDIQTVHNQNRHGADEFLKMAFEAKKNRKLAESIDYFIRAGDAGNPKAIWEFYSTVGYVGRNAGKIKPQTLEQIFSITLTTVNCSLAEDIPTLPTLSVVTWKTAMLAKIVSWCHRMIELPISAVSVSATTETGNANVVADCDLRWPCSVLVFMTWMSQRQELVDRPKYDDIVEKWTRAAEAGNVQAMVNLYDYYTHGFDNARNDRRAFEWCLRAAEAGSGQCLYTLSRYYTSLSRGALRAGREQVVDPSPERELHYLHLSAETFARAMHRLSCLYVSAPRRYNLEPNLEKSNDYLQRAVQLQYIPAIKTMAKRCQYGIDGVEKNVGECQRLLERMVEMAREKVEHSNNNTVSYRQMDLAKFHYEQGNIERALDIFTDVHTNRTYLQGKLRAAQEIVKCYERIGFSVTAQKWRNLADSYEAKLKAKCIHRTLVNDFGDIVHVVIDAPADDSEETA